MDNNDAITNKLKELDELKAKVEQLLSLSEIGDTVRQELESYKALRENGVTIPHLEKEFADQIYPRRFVAKKNNRMLTQAEIQDAIDRTTSAFKAAKVLGISYITFKKYAKKYNIHTTKGWPKTKNPTNIINKRGLTDPKVGKYPIQELLQGKFPDFPIHRLKDKLIRAHVKKAECEQCGYKERRFTDGKMPLLLNFEDGNNKNHKLENMRLLCYNCTFTCGKGYISKGPKVFDPDILQDSKKILNQRF